MPAELEQARIQNVERMPIRSQLLANFVYTVCKSFIATQTFLKQDANEKEALAGGRTKLIEKAARAATAVKLAVLTKLCR